jgi:hypothetical protein
MGSRLTGLNPPGGLVLAQLQLGKTHCDGSQEYPADSGLYVGPSMPPSWAATRRAAAAAKKREGSMGEKERKGKERKGYSCAHQHHCPMHGVSAPRRFI